MFALWIFGRMHLEQGVSSLLPVDCFSARCEAIHVFISLLWFAFFPDVFGCFLISQLASSWGGGEKSI